jgi:hypothetical protein
MPADSFATDLAAAIRIRAAIAGVEREYTVMELGDLLKARLHNPSQGDAVQELRPAPQCLTGGPRAGTIHVLLEKEAQSVESCSPQDATCGLTVHPSLFSRLEDYRQKSDPPAADASGRLDRECIALQGLLCGLLDHWDIAEDELEDVFKRSVDLTGSTYVNVHKGTLISFGDDDRFNTNPAYDRLGMSPYLLLPQSVLLHNERLLERADDAAALLAEGDNSGDSTSAQFQQSANGMDRLARKPKQKELYDAELKMRAALQKDWIPNLFHYSLEREIYDKGEFGRGLAAWKGSLIERLEELDGMLEETKAENANFINSTIGFIAFALAMAQVAGGWEDFAKAFLVMCGDENPHHETIVGRIFAGIGFLAYVAAAFLFVSYFVLFRLDLLERLKTLIPRMPAWLKSWFTSK